MVPIGYAAQRLPRLQQAVVNRSPMLPDGGHCPDLNVAPIFRAWPELSEGSAIAGLRAGAMLKLGHDQTAGAAWKEGSTRMIPLFGKEGPGVVDRQVTTTRWPLLLRRRGVYVRGGRSNLMVLGFAALWLLFCGRTRFMFLVNLRARSICRLAGWRRVRGLRVRLPRFRVWRPRLRSFKIAVGGRRRRPGRMCGAAGGA